MSAFDPKQTLMRCATLLVMLVASLNHRSLGPRLIILGRAAITKPNLFAAAAAITVLASCQQARAEVDTTKIEAQLKQDEARWNQAYAAHDAAALAGAYADDAALADPGAPLVTGSDAIRKETGAFAADPNLQVQFASDRIQVAASGDLAYTRGHYTLTMTDPKTKKPATSKGSYLTVWKVQKDGTWKPLRTSSRRGPRRPRDFKLLSVASTRPLSTNCRHCCFCYETSTVGRVGEKDMKPTDVLQRVYDAFAAGDSAALQSLIGDTDWVEASGGPYGGRYRGLAEVGASVFGPITRDVSDFSAKPDELLQVGENRALGLGFYRGSTAHGPMAIRFAHLATVDGGRITHLEQFTDTHEWHRALGS